MTCRRRYPRFLLRVPIQGSLRFATDAVFEQFDGEEIQVLSPVPAEPNELLRINDIAVRPPVGLGVRVTESEPVIVAGTLHHRLRLRGSSASAEGYRAEIMVNLGHQVPARVINICHGGCLIEAQEPVEPTSIGELVLIIGGRVSSGLVRVTRSVTIPGRGGTLHIGLQFIGRGSAGGSLPLAIGRLAEEEDWKAAEPATK